MKKLILLFVILLGVASGKAQNIDSLFYSGQDTTGWAQEIAIEEAAWSWTDTLIFGDYSKVDNYAINLKKKYKSITELAKDLTSPFEKEEEKVRAIFMWMVDNIAYDYILLARNKNSKGHTVNYSRKTTKAELAEKWEKIYYDYATTVLKNRRGICEGYSTLFYELCRASGISCEMVNGYADDDLEKVNRYKKSKSCPTMHAWNKVQINDQWLYIDVTWSSSGKYDGRRHESEYYNPYYYLVAESKLYETHIENKKRTIKRNELVGNY